MGKVVRGEFPVIQSCAAEAAELGCGSVTVWRRRRGQDLPPYVRAVDGRIYRSRALTYEQRKKRDRRIKLALECGMTRRWIREHLHVSNSVIGAVAARTPHRRKAHVLSQRAWRDRGNLRKETE